MNNDDFEILMGHPRHKNEGWIEQKDWICKKFSGVDPVWLVKCFEAVEGARHVQSSWNKFCWISHFLNLNLNKFQKFWRSFA